RYISGFMFYFSLLFCPISACSHFFFFTDPAPTAIYTLSLHDALPISPRPLERALPLVHPPLRLLALHPRLEPLRDFPLLRDFLRSEEHTSELQSRENLVCRLLLEKKKKKKYHTLTDHYITIRESLL